MLLAAVRTEIDVHLETTMVTEAAAMLERVRLRNTQRLDWLVSREAKAHNWPADLARNYIGELLSFEPDDRAKQAVALFFEKLRVHNLLDAADPVWHTLQSAQAGASN